MNEEPRIKINVDYIFNLTPLPNENSDNQNHYSISEHSSILEPIPNLHLEQSKELSNIQPISANPNRTTQTKVTAQTQLLNLNKLIKEKETTIKKLDHVDTSKITAKLFQQKSPVCSRSLKKPARNMHLVCKQSPPKNEREPSSQANAGRTSRSNLSRTDVHQRLYNLSKSQHLKDIYMPSQPQRQQQPQVHRKSVSSLTASKYLKNYTPFEKRLEQYLNRDQLTASQSILRNEKDFRPQLIHNKYTDRVQSRYRQGQLRQAKAGEFADFMNSSVSSSCLSATSRSAAMALRAQEHFLQKMKLVFVRGLQDEVQVEEGTVGLLTEVEFSVLQPFIMQIEENRIKGVEFEQKFKAFYEALTVPERMQLRNHEIKNKCKYLQLKQEIKQRKSPRKQLSKVLEIPYAKPPTKPFPKRQSRCNTNYHLVIQNFI